MRVIAGQAKSVRLLVPPNVRVRPTADVVREALFSSLADRVVGVRFLDVYAGTGAVGIEALSRGASFCVFIERNHGCVKAIRANLENTGLAERAVIVEGDAERVTERVVREYGPFGMVFLDPPYADVRAVRVAEFLMGAAGSPALLIMQHSKSAQLKELGQPDRIRKFGETSLSWYELPHRGRD